jgi:hypothetical protein
MRLSKNTPKLIHRVLTVIHSSDRVIHWLIHSAIHTHIHYTLHTTHYTLCANLCSGAYSILSRIACILLWNIPAARLSAYIHSASIACVSPSSYMLCSRGSVYCLWLSSLVCRCIYCKKFCLVTVRSSWLSVIQYISLISTAVNSKLWLVNSKNFSEIERIWQHCQRCSIDMYRTRISCGVIGWVVETQSNAQETRLLLEFSQSISEISGVYYRVV